jgi:N-acetylmuramoyl-L-alanine amidase
MRILLLFLLLPVLLAAQESKTVNCRVGSDVRDINAVSFNGLTYISALNLAEQFNINFFYNGQRRKMELKFANHNLTVTAKNPFYVLNNKSTGAKSTYQLPVATLLFEDQIYIPVTYSISYLNTCFEQPVRFEVPDPVVTVDITEVTGEDTVTLIDTSAITPPVEFDTDAANIIKALQVDVKENGTLMRIIAKSNIESLRHSLSGNVIHIRMVNAALDTAKMNRTFSKGLIEEIRGRYEGNTAELFVKLSDDFKTYEIIGGKNSPVALLTVHSKEFRDKFDKDNKKERWVFDVVVIDPGHGGKDHGAIGVGGVREKDINLALSQKVADLIKANLPEVQVLLTRYDDIFVPLNRRGQIANENNGKLFISIHCNSVAKKKQGPNGFEFYLLRPGKTDDAIRIAEMENSVIKYEDNPDQYEELTDENFILVSMAHSSYMKYSEEFADKLVDHFSTKTSLKNRGVKQAGFYVLVGASMPSVLVEAGFLSNPNDAKYLNSEAGQNDIAKSIFHAIKSFKDYYDKSMEGE